MKNKLLDLKNNLNYQGLKKEAKIVDDLIKFSLFEHGILTPEKFTPMLEEKDKMFIRFELNRLAGNHAWADEVGNNILDAVELVCDILGVIPIGGAVPDVISLVISIFQKDWMGSLFNLIGLIPEVGTWLKNFLKVERKIKCAYLLDISKFVLKYLDKLDYISSTKTALRKFRASMIVFKQTVQEYIGMAEQNPEKTLDIGGNLIESTGTSNPPSQIPEGSSGPNQGQPEAPRASGGGGRNLYEINDI